MLREALMRIKRDSRVMQFPRGEISSNIYRVKKNSARLSEWKKSMKIFMQMKVSSRDAYES